MSVRRMTLSSCEEMEAMRRVQSDEEKRENIPRSELIIEGEWSEPFFLKRMADDLDLTD